MRYHGAKFRLAPWIISFFPSHDVYVDAFGGAGGIFLNKPRSRSEVYNDLDDDTVNVFRVLQNKEQSNELQRLLLVTPFARREFEISYDDTDDPVEKARRTLIRSSMGFGSAGATKHKTGFRVDSAREYGTAAQLWERYPAQISEFCKRFKGVLIENRPALSVIASHDSDNTLFYLDPPYMHETRDMGSNRRYYQHEMSDEEHKELLEFIQDLKGSVIISGYESELYNDMLSEWQKKTTTSRISAGRGTGIRNECLWISPSIKEGQLCINF